MEKTEKNNSEYTVDLLFILKSLLNRIWIIVIAGTVAAAAGFVYSAFPEASDAKKAELIKGAVNFLCALNKQEQRADFMKNCALMHNAVTLCRSLLSDEQLQFVAFFDAVRVLLLKFEAHGQGGKAQQLLCRYPERDLHRQRAGALWNLYRPGLVLLR